MHNKELKELINALETGELRAARRNGDAWVVHKEVKQCILDLFRNSQVVNMPGGFCDKEPLVPRTFDASSKVRMVPGGSSVRAGAYVGSNVVIMPPAYINIGAYVDDGTMVDSHALVGSCAQIGKRVHLSAGVQIGGVLEPVGGMPVIIEDDCFIGAGSVVVQGVRVRSGAVLAPNVTLSESVPIYDLSRNAIYKGSIPSNAVVVPGTRAITSNNWAKAEGLSVGCAIIIKYRDEKTDASVALEDFLR